MASQKFEKSFSVDQDEKSLSFLVKQTLHIFNVVDGRRSRNRLFRLFFAAAAPAVCV